MSDAEQKKPPTYAIVRSRKFEMTGIKCLVCGLTSYNSYDFENKYCGNCHKFHEESPERQADG